MPIFVYAVEAENSFLNFIKFAGFSDNACSGEKREYPICRGDAARRYNMEYYGVS
jgi:hypothetical protein